MEKRKTIIIRSESKYIFLESLSFNLTNVFTQCLLNNFSLRKFIRNNSFLKKFIRVIRALDKIAEKTGEIKVFSFNRKNICLYEWNSNKVNSEILPDIMTIISDTLRKNEVIEFKLKGFREEEFEKIEIFETQKEMNKKMKEIFGSI